jgi:hypothetical protein
MDEGSILLARGILNSQVFAHQTALKIWIWCLCRATFKERFVSVKIGKGETTVKLKPGEFIFGRFKAEEELGIDGSTIYKWMQKFANPDFDMVKIQSNSQYSIISICNWQTYQYLNGKRVTTKEQPSNNQVTAEEQPSNTNNKDNNGNNVELRSASFVSEVYTYQNQYSPELLKAFSNYWTEKNKSGTKMRFEIQPTFEISKRLATWASKDKQFSKTEIPVKPEFGTPGVKPESIR